MYKRLLAVGLGVALIAPVFAFAQGGPVDMSARSGVRAQTQAQVHTDTPARVEVRTNAGAALDTTGQARAARAKERAVQEIERRIHMLNAARERINSMDRVSDTFKARLRAHIDAEIQDVSTLRARINASTDEAKLRDEVQSVTRTHREFALVVPQAHIAAAAEKIVTMTAIMSELGAKLQSRIDTAEAAGEDVADLKAALRDLAARIDSANVHAQAAIRGTADLEPDEGDEEVLRANQAALQAAREELRLAHQDIVAGREDIRTIISGLKSFSRNEDPAIESDTEVEADVE